MRAEPATILVVDDDEAIRELVALVLREAGYAVTEATSGAAALQIVRSAPPSLLLLDYAMPTMSGREVLERLVETGASIPVLVLSASLHAEACLAEGAACLVRKPFVLTDLLAAVAWCLMPATARPPLRARSALTGAPAATKGNQAA